MKFNRLFVLPLIILLSVTRRISVADGVLLSVTVITTFI
jgi:hypothetical protein